MSTLMTADNGRLIARHDIEVAETSAQVLSHSSALIEHPVDWPHMWYPGDRVLITMADGAQYVGGVLSVSRVTKKVLIQLL